MEGCIVRNLQEVHHGGGNFWMLWCQKTCVVHSLVKGIKMSTHLHF